MAATVMLNRAKFFILVMLFSAMAGCSLEPYAIQQAPVRPDQAVVFDIDGTLTPKPLSVFSVRDDAAQAVQLYADSGYKIIYLSARIQILQRQIPGWLKKHGFPEGSIHVPNSSEESSDFAAFKASVLKRYVAKGWKLEAAYGDSSTDYEAYVESGIAKDDIIALKRVGEDECEPGTWSHCYDSWAEQLDQIALRVGIK